MIIYHGSNVEVKYPRIISGKFNKDFGDGFYCTNLEEQAKRWTLKYDTRIVNIYEYNENNNLNIKSFDEVDLEWLDFVAASRSGKKHSYDIVIGPMADDQIYNYINDYIDGLITKEAFLELAKFKHPTHQIVFCNEEALKYLTFKESKVIEDV